MAILVLSLLKKYSFTLVSTKYEANKREWSIRRMIWDFKDGKRSASVAELVAKKMREQFGAEVCNVTLVCIPASSGEKNEIRYKAFAEEVARLAVNVRRGQEVRRGDIIGLSGNTGLSIAPHLHYEVRHNGMRVDPIHYFFMELSPVEYQRIIRIAQSGMQSFD